MVWCAFGVGCVCFCWGASAERDEGVPELLDLIALAASDEVEDLLDLDLGMGLHKHGQVPGLAYLHQGIGESHPFDLRAEGGAVGAGVRLHFGIFGEELLVLPLDPLGQPPAVELPGGLGEIQVSSPGVTEIAPQFPGERVVTQSLNHTPLDPESIDLLWVAIQDTETDQAGDLADASPPSLRVEGEMLCVDHARTFADGVDLPCAVRGHHEVFDIDGVAIAVEPHGERLPLTGLQDLHVPFAITQLLGQAEVVAHGPTDEEGEVGRPFGHCLLLLADGDGDGATCARLPE